VSALRSSAAADSGLQTDAQTARRASSTVSLWSRYRRRGDQAARAELLERHLELVRLLARKLAMRIGGVVEVDDLVSAGTLGLVQALESYDLSRGNAFATFASRRIHGAMLDELRNRDWVPRSVRSKARKLHRATAQVEAGLGRAAASQEVAANLGIDVATYWSWRRTVDGSALISLGAGIGQDSDETEGLLGIMTEPGAVDALTELGQEESVATLAAGLTRMPERERTVLVLYFYEDLNLREIAQVLHLTESRISQIRTAALRRLRLFLCPALSEAC
jgi:RNA polymerase sigma factor for flagellar operon FliA